ncbi:MAG: hypothetical protein LRY61_06370 [Burkholderiaceae bacterium]|nr:hypothetical protein [Burkholderiaceae bacterium]
MMPSPQDAGEALTNEFGLLMIRLIEFVTDDLSPNTLNAAWLDFNHGADPEMDPESSEVLGFFFPWMLLNWCAEIPESVVERFGSDTDQANDSKESLVKSLEQDLGQDADGTVGEEPVVVFPPVAQMFLACIDGLDDPDGKYQNQTVSDTERSLIEQAMMAPYTFFQVKEKIGKYVKLKDLLVPAEHYVFSPNLVDDLESGSVIYGQVVTVRGVSIVTSIAPLMLSPDIVEPLSHVREKMMDMLPELGSDWRHAMAEEIRGLYRSMAGDFEQDEPDDQDKEHPANMAEDPSRPVLTILKYQLPGDLENNLQALAHLSGNTAEELLCTVEPFTEEVDGIEGEGVHFPWVGDDDGDGQGLHLGEIRITKDRLVAHLVGEGTGQMIEQEIARQMGSRARLMEREVMTVGDMMGELAKQRVAERVARRKKSGRNKGGLH